MLLASLVFLLQTQYEVVLVKNAARQADSIALWTKVHRVEPAACVSDYRVSISNDNIYTFVIYNFTPGDVDTADSLHVTWKNICGDTLPGVHAHLLALGAVNYPSPTDYLVASQEQRKKVPFDLVIIINENWVISDVIPYSVKIKRRE